MATAAVGAVAGVLPAVAETRGADTALERLLHDDRHTVLVASHRACWKRTSENSIDGIRRCAADGIDIVEIDVRTTRDGVLVLMHDENVDRTTDGHGAVSTLTAADIARLRLREGGGGPNTALTDRHVPTFAQALAAVRGRVLMNIDVKAAALDRVIDAVVAAQATRAVILNVPIDVDPSTMRRARDIGIATQPVYLERQYKGSAVAALTHAATLKPTSIQLIFDTPSVVDTAHRTAPETRLFVNTMAFDIERGTPMNLSGPYLDTRAVTDPEAIWGILIKHGVTIIQTDEPWRLQAWLKAKKLR